MKGEVAAVIVQTAEEERADLIMMPLHSFTFFQFLMGSVTAKVLHGTECPVWTGAHVKELPMHEFAIRNVLCAVDFGPRRTLLFHGPLNWPPTLVGVSRSLTSLPGWSYGGPAAASSIKDGKKSSTATHHSK